MKYVIFNIVMLFSSYVQAQDAAALIRKVKAKMEIVNNYQASGVMKTNVPFLKVPVSQVKVYFKRPDKIKIRNEKGISLIPKGALSMTVNNLMAEENYTAIAAGSVNLNNRQLTVVKLLPLNPDAEVVLSTLYIDEAALLIIKAVTTTRENGTYQVEMQYGRYAAYALPDRATFTFNTKAYKLPKGVTFDYDDGSRKSKPLPNAENDKGRLELTYSAYIINKGIDDAIFK